MSLIALLGGVGIVLLVFGKFSYLGWKEGNDGHVHPQMLPGVVTPSQRATLKYFIVVILLFLAQALVGGATAHYRADASGFYGFDISNLLPSNLLRTWHLQLAIFWIAMAYVAGGLRLAPTIGGRDLKRQVFGVNLLFVALVVVVGGSMFGELLGINRMLGNLWFWIGHQGWEYLELGRAWQALLALGLVIWLVLLFRAVTQRNGSAEKKEISSLFLYGAVAIPLFYLPAFFFNSNSHFSVVDTWRFWIIHLWVEGFFELFVTVLVAVIFHYLGLVSDKVLQRAMLTPNHGHASMMGVFGTLAVALVVFALRQVSSDQVWARCEKYVRVSFSGLNGGLLLMIILNLFPGGVLQLLDVFDNGYWHARSPLFMNQPIVRLIEWLRMPADLIFIGLGVVPLLIAGLLVYAESIGARQHQPSRISLGQVPGAVEGGD